MLGHAIETPCSLRMRTMKHDDPNYGGLLMCFRIIASLVSNSTTKHDNTNAEIFISLLWVGITAPVEPAQSCWNQRSAIVVFISLKRLLASLTLLVLKFSRDHTTAAT